MARPDTPSTSLATEPSLMLASSSTFWIRLATAVCSLTNCVRCRVRSRSSRCHAGGTKLARSKPCCSNCAIHAQSLTSVLRPGTCLMCWALTKMTRKRPSNRLKSGFQ